MLTRAAPRNGIGLQRPASVTTRAVVSPEQRPCVARTAQPPGPLVRRRDAARRVRGELRAARARQGRYLLRRDRAVGAREGQDSWCQCCANAGRPIPATRAASLVACREGRGRGRGVPRSHLDGGSRSWTRGWRWESRRESVRWRGPVRAAAITRPSPCERPLGWRHGLRSGSRAAARRSARVRPGQEAGSQCRSCIGCADRFAGA